MTGAAPVLLAAAADGGGTGVPLRELLLVGLTAAAMTYLLTSAVRVFAIRAGAVAVPRVRDVHVIPTPRLGGLGMFGGVVAGIALAANLPALNRGFAYTTDMTAVIAAGTVIVLVGVVDDRWGLDALTKFVGQLTAAGVLVLLGISWLQLYIPFADIGTLVLDPLQAGLLTVAITVATINAINFVDGLDGLAAGLGLIAAAAICMFSLGLLRDQGGDVSYYPPALISVALAGACLGFLPHNFSPARIFMGDSGAMLIGLLLAAASTSASGRIAVNAYGPADIFTLLSPLILVAAVVFIPMLDMLLAVIRRTRAGVGFYTPDKMHLHHRLLELGHSQRRVALIIYLWVGVLAFSAAASTLFPLSVVAPAFGAGLVVAMLVTMAPRLHRRLAELRTSTKAYH
ncbi:undecaprenyl-phosphate alpha-N-acetylglucosaminyl 1-phosphate transferase [Gordonia sp. JH63]|uniref:glycosyltransferase family 4 protein n=1 Tax=Gordonia TaxID=2053 RepID=UPI0006E1C53D|nr:MULTISPECIES: MraY family glycosyltransferase [unclassified Gordonia (in: high G+C Gram-positive bacteria)]OCW88034.1 undecaprenyl-phosphate alpha-N-acetylglucosaminyl 1-phosphate transferase [Nocardia farcinica]MBN0973191.1 undecaprenyl/decaprenyl-phosphate alpha-N-acetylglucosaminyl 1-phosphate transferase [Gordonia sp. BP-119]MBN0983224.1 undecaprenyl/decaprenyl-phosphate alpha-N-acetylglucosaminyl 1-phosphate transferase [Gordonia sp. BP-94]MCT1354477.1 undecaprenyl/decaprenyl-phosphate 